MKLKYYQRIAPNTFTAIDSAETIVGFEFKNAIWGRDPESNIFIASAHRAKCIMHLSNGNTMSFELADDETPEDVVARIDSSPYDDDDDF